MITVVASTNRPGSNSAKVAHYYLEMLQRKGAEAQLLDLADIPTDFLGNALYHNAGKHLGFNPMRQLMEDSKKFVFVVPEYNGSYPGALKAFIDGLKYPSTFLNKKAALVGLSNGIQGNLLGMSHLTDVFNYLGMMVLPLKVKLPQFDKNFDHQLGQFTNQLYINLLDQQADQIIQG